MKLIYGYCCEQGAGRKKNQDAMLLKLDRVFKRDVCIAAVSDGVGSFEHSDFASNSIRNLIAAWFDRSMNGYKTDKKNKSSGTLFSELKNELREELWLAHKVISDATEARNINSAATVCVILTVGNLYCVYSSGDSRIYEFGKKIRQLTKDQVTNHNGRMVLSNCMGCFPGPDLVKTEGKIRKNTSYIIATDGFYRKLDPVRVMRDLAKAKTSGDMQKVISDTREFTINAGEKDDSTGIALKFV